VWNTLGVVLVTAGEVELAMNAFEQAIARGAPPVSGSNLLFALHTAAGVDAQAAFRAIQTCTKRITEGVTAKAHPLRSVAGRPLRVGYLWAYDLNSTRYFTHSVLLSHDPAAVTLLGYVASPEMAEVEQNYGRHFAGLRPIAKLDDNAAARLMEQDELDLLVDLCGHTHRQRLRLLARRVAPVQATWIESFFSTGVEAVDYLITDHLHTPPGTAQRFVEAPFRLPTIRFCYTPPSAPDVGPLPAVANGFVTLGSFNHLSKLNREVTAVWASILKTIPKSRLILKWRSLEDPGTRDRIARRFAQHGVAADRLDLRGHSEHAEMLAQYNEIDLALDPFPYNGGLTTCEALWMGVPVLCLRGQEIISRQSAAVSRAAGVEGFTADDLAGYTQLALAWSRDLERLAAVRAGLRETLARSPLCDALRCTRDLEQAYRFMVGAAQ
jgi:predicted O-linked N-acetylglucosamine transferase (SPINDLY family)